MKIHPLYMHWFNLNKDLLITDNWEQLSEKAISDFGWLGLIKIGHILREAEIFNASIFISNLINKNPQKIFETLETIIKKANNLHITTNLDAKGHWVFYIESASNPTWEGLRCDFYLSEIGNRYSIVFDSDPNICKITACGWNDFIAQAHNKKLFGIDWLQYEV